MDQRSQPQGLYISDAVVREVSLMKRVELSLVPVIVIVAIFCYTILAYAEITVCP